VTTVDAYEHYGGFDFKTHEEAKQYVIEKYEWQWGEGTIIVFHKTPLGLMLEVEDRIFIIRKDRS